MVCVSPYTLSFIEIEKFNPKAKLILTLFIVPEKT